MITVTREFEFDAGHRVLGHEGKCKRLHGHHYRALVTCVSPELDNLGRVVDFGVMKDKIGYWIDKNWDHNMILNMGDPLAGMYLESSNKDKQCPIFGFNSPYILTKNPTAEVLAEHLFIKVFGLMERHCFELKVVSVRMYETPKCYADYTPEG